MKRKSSHIKNLCFRKDSFFRLVFCLLFAFFGKTEKIRFFLELSMDLGQRVHCFFFILNSIPWIYVLQENIEIYFSIQLQIWNFLPKNEILKIPIDQCLPKAKLDSDIVWKMPPNNAISDYRCSVFGFAPPLWRLCLHPSTYHFHSFYLHTESILYLPINPQMGFVGG